ADLLEVRELCDLHAVHPDLPAESPGALRRGFPIVFDEADVVLERVDAHSGEAAQIQVLDVLRAWLQEHLELVVCAPTVRVLAVAAVSGPSARLHVRNVE